MDVEKTGYQRPSILASKINPDGRFFEPGGVKIDSLAPAMPFIGPAGLLDVAKSSEVQSDASFGRR